MTTASVTLPLTGPAAFTPEASPEDLRRWLDAGDALLIDVREPDEFASERIAGARLVPLSKFDPALALAMALPKQKIVFQCRSGKRSADALRLASSMAGPHEVMSLRGGIEAWKAAGLPVLASGKGGGLSVMRQVQLVIGVMVLGGAALAAFVHPYFAGVPAFFGAGLVFAGASGTCGLAALLSKMPWNRPATAPRQTAAHPAKNTGGCCGGSSSCCKH